MNRIYSLFKLLIVFILVLGVSNTPILAVNAAGGQCTKAPSGMVSWWPGDGNTDDIVGNYNGTLQNGATFASGMVLRSFSFDGIDDYVSVPDSSSWTFGDDEFTIDLWVNFDTIPSRAPFVDHNEGGGEFNKWIFWYDEAGHREPGGPALRFHINSSTLGPLDTVVYPWLPNTGQWYHVAVTRSGSNYVLYIDGQQVITETDSNTIPDAEVDLTIGQSELQYFFDGLIDEVEIFNRALTPTEIANIYNAGGFGKCRDVTICHMSGGAAEKTLTIPLQALNGHLGHGDTIGACQ